MFACMHACMYVCMHLSSEVRRARRSRSSEHPQQITLDIASTSRDCTVTVMLRCDQRQLEVYFTIEVPADRERLVSEWLDVDQSLVRGWSDSGLVREAGMRFVGDWSDIGTRLPSGCLGLATGGCLEAIWRLARGWQGFG